MRVAGQHPHAEATEQLAEDHADPAGPDHAHGLAVEVETEQSPEFEVAIAHAAVGPVDVPVRGEQQRQAVLRDRERRVFRHPQHLDPVSLRRGEIDVVETGAAQRDQADPAPGQLPDGIGVELVVHEHADRVEPLRERGGLTPQAILEVAELVSGAGRAEILAIMRLGGKNGDFHGRKGSSIRANPRRQDDLPAGDFS